MRIESDWRRPTYAEEFADFDYADFAQEFLRRNPDYRREYHDAERDIAPGDKDAQTKMEVLARRWGFVFSLRAGLHRR